MNGRDVSGTFQTFEQNHKLTAMRLIVILLLPALLFTACGETIRGDGNVTTESREVDDFHSIQVSGIFEIELIEGDGKVEVVADANLHEHILTKVRDGKLKIYTENKYLKGEELLIRIYYDQLNSISLAGAAKVGSKSTIRGKSFELEVAGAAEAELKVRVTRLVLDLAGGSEVKISGSAEMAEIDIAGAGDVEGLDLQTQQCSIDISGAGEIEIGVEQSLDVNVTGAGEVRYRGNPSEINRSITGAGEVKQI